MGWLMPFVNVRCSSWVNVLDQLGKLIVTEFWTLNSYLIGACGLLWIKYEVL